jgi:hypothetical protein
VRFLDAEQAGGAEQPEVAEVGVVVRGHFGEQ